MQDLDRRLLEQIEAT